MSEDSLTLTKQFDGAVLAGTDLAALNQKAFETLMQILEDPDLPATDRAAIALQILSKAGVLSANNSATNLITQLQRKSQSAALVGAHVASASTQVDSSSTSEERFFPAQYFQLDNFLPTTDAQKILSTALEREQDFVPTTTTASISDYRQSSVLWGNRVPAIKELIASKVLDTLPQVLKALGHRDFTVDAVEMQMTAHNDGCFYKIHLDAMSESTFPRELTYVYYFYQEPKAFSGGELKIYDTTHKGRQYIAHETSQLVQPRNNSIVFFNSRCKHEVLPINCPSREFSDSRFTLNGWVRRPD